MLKKTVQAIQEPPPPPEIGRPLLPVIVSYRIGVCLGSCALHIPPTSETVSEARRLSTSSVRLWMVYLYFAMMFSTCAHNSALSSWVPFTFVAARRHEVPSGPVLESQQHILAPKPIRLSHQYHKDHLLYALQQFPTHTKMPPSGHCLVTPGGPGGLILGLGQGSATHPTTQPLPLGEGGVLYPTPTVTYKALD